MPASTGRTGRAPVGPHRPRRHRPAGACAIRRKFPASGNFEGREGPWGGPVRGVLGCPAVLRQSCAGRGRARSCARTAAPSGCCQGDRDGLGRRPAGPPVRKRLRNGFSLTDACL